MTTTPLHRDSFKTGSPKSPVKPLTAKQQGIDAMVRGAVAKTPAAQEEAEEAEDVARAAAQREAGAWVPPPTSCPKSYFVFLS